MQLGGACGRVRAVVPEAVPDGGSSPPPAFYSISFPSGGDRSREDSAAHTASQPPERERSAATCTEARIMPPRGPYIPEAGKTNPVSHGHCVSVQLLFSQQEVDNHAIRHHDGPGRARGRRVRAADSSGVKTRRDAATFRCKVNRQISIVSTLLSSRRAFRRKRKPPGGNYAPRSSMEDGRLHAAGQRARRTGIRLSPRSLSTRARTCRAISDGTSPPGRQTTQKKGD